MIVQNVRQVSLDESLLIDKMKLRGPSIPKGLSVSHAHAAHADPLFVMKAFPVDEISGGRVTIGESVFESSILARVLGGVERVFVYVATCGPKMAARTRQMTDMFDRYMAEGTEHFFLSAARDALENRLEAELGHRNFTQVNPGIIEGWSTLDIAKIIDLLDGKPYELGMSLTDSGLMLPSRSICGFFFKSKTPHVNCLLCRYPKCPERKVPFNQEMYDDFTKEERGKPTHPTKP